MLNYIQDNENIKDSAINTMLKDTASAFKAKNKKGADGSFSAIMNNLNSKTQKTQTNFVDKVAKSNTSSINKKVFDNSSNSADTKTALKTDNKSKSSDLQDTSKTAKKTSKKEQAVENIKKENLNNSANSDDTTVNTNQKSENTDSAPLKNVEETVVTAKTNENTEIKNNDTSLNTQKLSDINDNSSVEPSPVFLNNNDEVVESTDVALEQNDIVANAATVIMPVAENNQQTTKETSTDEHRSEFIEVKTSDNVVNEVDKTQEEFNPKEDNDNDTLLNTFDKPKEVKTDDKKEPVFFVGNNKEENTEQVDLTLKTDKVLPEEEKVQTTDFSFGTDEKVLVATDYSSDFKKPEIENSVNLEPLETEKTDVEQDALLSLNNDKRIITENKTILSDDKISDVEISDKNADYKPELKPADNTEPKVSADVKEENAEIRPELIEYDDEIDIDNDFDGNKEVNLKDKIVFKTKDDVKTDEEPDVTVEDNNKTVSLNDGNSEKPQKTVIIDDDKAYDNEYDDNTLALNTQNTEIKPKTEVKTNSEEKPAEQKLENNNVLSQAQDNSETPSKNNQEFKQNDNTSKLADNKPDSDSVKKAEIPQTKITTEDDSSEEIEISDKDVEETRLFAKVEQNSDMDTEQQGVQTGENNLEKLAFEQEKLDEMLVSMSKQVINTGALTVADEVAKIAINEDTSIVSPINVNYDGAGENIFLKNVQMLRQGDNILNQFQQKLENSNILSQLTEKFEQIKDTINQKFTMVLRPNDLGRLSIELTNGLKGLITNIVVQNEHVRDFIEKNINSLRNQLASAGVNVNQIQIKTAGTGESTTYSGNQEQTNSEESKENFNQNENNNKENQNNKQYRDNLLASLANFDTSFADDFSNVLNKTISYELN